MKSFAEILVASLETYHDRARVKSFHFHIPVSRIFSEMSGRVQFSC